MKNKDLFTLNPDENNLVNDGVVEINTTRDDQGLKVIRHELQTFVCEGEYQRGLERILSTYLKHLDQPKQPAVWVSGFFGSGKSHLVKMLGFLWENFAFPNGDTARSLKPLPADVADALTELGRKQKLYGTLAVSGTLKDFHTTDIRYAFLQLFLSALKLPTQYHLFKFVHWARQEGIYDALDALLTNQGKSLKKEIENLFVSAPLAQAVLTVKPGFADSEAKVRENFKVNFKPVDGISREALLSTLRNEVLPLFFGSKIPCTLLVLDEVQQFIGQDGSKTIDIQNLAQDLCSNFDGRFLLVGTGQSALSETPYLQPLQDRFSVKVSLSDTDVETVTRKTVLEKKPSVVAALNQKLDSSLGEIARNLSGTDFGYLTADRATLAADYPILPSTRKFWKKILQVIDVAGTSGQLRSQLRIVDDSLKFVANRDLGQVVPADFIFETKQQQLIQNALLLNETNNLIQERKARGDDDALEGRILSVVFLADRLPQDAPGRLKTDADTLADLLLSDLNQPSDAFRTKVNALIQKLADQKILMPIGSEYKLQTKVGAEWEQEFTAQVVKLNNADDRLHQLRKERLLQFFRERLRSLNVLQGVSKQKREADLHAGTDRPNTEQKLNLWLRDGWFEAETTVLNEIRAEGPDAPLAYAYVRKQRDADLRSELIKFLAADLTLQAKGLPTTPEGEQARKSMETRRQGADAALKDLVETLGRDAAVYLAGGNRVDTGDLRQNLDEALHSLADRQFPDFKSKADCRDWDKALTRALGNAPDAFKAIGWDKDPHTHPVAVEVLRFVGNQTRWGRDVRQHFAKAPYGWSQDAVDATLVMLRLTEHLSTPEPIATAAKVAATEFKRESHTLSAKEKIQLRQLYQHAGLSVKPGEEFGGSNALLARLRSLAEGVGGDSPRPEPVSTQFLKDLENLDGNERLLRLVQEAADLRAKFDTWTAQAALVAQREPDYRLLSQLLPFAPPDPAHQSLRTEAEALRTDRLLLSQPDPVGPLLQRLTEALRQALNDRKQTYNDRFDALMDDLQANAYFAKLPPADKHGILARHQLLVKPELKAHNAPELLVSLQKVPLDAWQTRLAALPAQFGAALDEAIAQSAPKARPYPLPKRTLETPADLDAYLADLRTDLEALLSQGGGVILK